MHFSFQLLKFFAGNYTTFSIICVILNKRKKRKINEVRRKSYY